MGGIAGASPSSQSHPASNAATSVKTGRHFIDRKSFKAIPYYYLCSQAAFAATLTHTGIIITCYSCFLSLA
jgi:hypothetical protein